MERMAPARRMSRKAPVIATVMLLAIAAAFSGTRVRAATGTLSCATPGGTYVSAGFQQSASSGSASFMPGTVIICNVVMTSGSGSPSSWLMIHATPTATPAPTASSATFVLGSNLTNPATATIQYQANDGNRATVVFNLKPVTFGTWSGTGVGSTTATTMLSHVSAADFTGAADSDFYNATMGAGAVTVSAVALSASGSNCSATPVAGTYTGADPDNTTAVSEDRNDAGTPTHCTVTASYQVSGGGMAGSFTITEDAVFAFVSGSASLICTPGSSSTTTVVAVGQTVSCTATGTGDFAFTSWAGTNFSPASSASASTTFTAGSPGAGSIVASYAANGGASHTTFAYTIVSTASLTPGFNMITWAGPSRSTVDDVRMYLDANGLSGKWGGLFYPVPASAPLIFRWLFPQGNSATLAGVTQGATYIVFVTQAATLTWAP